MHAIVLGSGLSSFSDHFNILKNIPLHNVLNVEFNLLEGHNRHILMAEDNGKEFIIISGKLHYYEGHSFAEICEPLSYACNHFDLESILVTSASGGLNKDIRVGEWVSIRSIICIPQIPINIPIQSRPLATKLGPIKHLKSATYAFHQGPSLGTAAEYKMLHNLGADVVGMSIYPEKIFLDSNNIESHFLSLPVCSYYPFDNIKEPSHAEVIRIADRSVLDLVKIFKSYLHEIKQ